MNETKVKIHEMIKEEKAEKRKEKLDEQRQKKGNKKKIKGAKKDRSAIKIDQEKKKLVRLGSFIILLLALALGLFYAASVSKTSVENNFQKQVKANAEKELNNLQEQAELILRDKIANFDYILKDAEYIENFNDPSWQGVLQTELPALLGYQAVIEIIPENYSDEMIIDKPDMGYAVLGLLEELKNAKKKNNDIKIEVHRANTKNARLVIIRKVSYRDVDADKMVTVGYIYASMSPLFVKELIKEFKYSSGYVEIIQRFSGRSMVLARKGDGALKSLPVSVSQKIRPTQWQLKLWPAQQQVELSPQQLWLPLLLLVLGTACLVFTILMLVRLVSRLVKKTESDKAETKTADKTVKPEAIDEDYVPSTPAPASDIRVDDDKAVDKEYLTLVLNKIFRAYDIRGEYGEYGEYINSEIFREIAMAIAREMNEIKQTRISVARDGRNSSPELHKVITDTLVECGLQVLDIGMVTSSVLYFAALTKTDGNGLIVTASHNPSNYNGIKILVGGHCYGQERLEKLKERILSPEQAGPTPAEQNGTAGKLEQFNIMEEYITKITGNVLLARPMNIVIDTANGVAGSFAATFFEQMGCQVTALNAEVDGNFPVHEPDPSRPENLTQLIKKVTEIKADVGFAFDGDGDRLALVSSGGDIVWPDRILMLLAKDILSRNKEATILYDVKSSSKLESFIRELGGKPMMCKSGHSFMKSKLLETGALLAGEMSGHIFIKDRWYGFDDGLFVAARILEILSIDLRKSRQIFAELPDALNTPEILIATPDAHGIIEKLDSNNAHFNGGNVITIDGIRVEYPDGWGLVRASNTSDNLTMRFEADNEKAVQRIANSFKAALMEVEPGLEFPF